MAENTPRISKIGIKDKDGVTRILDLAVESEDIIPTSTPVPSADVANKLGTITVGDVIKPMFLKNGVPTECNFIIEKSVPAEAVFTDTTYKTVSENNSPGLITYNDYIAFSRMAQQSGYSLATKETPGLVRPGRGLSIDNGIINIDIPTASDTDYGLVKIGKGLAIDGESKLNINLDTASTSTKGLMSSSDKQKLDDCITKTEWNDNQMGVPPTATSVDDGIPGVVMYTDSYNEEYPEYREDPIVASAKALYDCYTHLQKQIDTLSENNDDNPSEDIPQEPIVLESKQPTITVGPSSGKYDYTSLSEALSNISTEDYIIDIYSLTETLISVISQSIHEINGHGNVVLGNGISTIIINSGIKFSNIIFATKVIVNAPGVVFENCSFINTQTGVQLMQSGCSFKNCTFDGPEIGIEVETSGIELYNNIFKPPFRYGGEGNGDIEIPPTINTDYCALKITYSGAYILAIGNIALDENLTIDGYEPSILYGSSSNNIPELNYLT